MDSEKQYYKIIVEGLANLDWSSSFDEVTVQHSEDGQTIISGALPDQTALHGVLMRIRDLGFSLVEVKRIDKSQGTEGE
jgi:hypothetical protein